MKNRLVGSLRPLTSAAVASLLALASTQLCALTLNDVSMERLTWNGFSSQYGTIDVDLTLSLSDTTPLYMNVTADLNHSGTISDYSVGPDIQTEWVTRNVPVFPSLGDNLLLGNTFPLLDSSVSLANMSVSITPAPLPSPIVGSSFSGESVLAGARLVSGGGKEVPITGLMPEAATLGYNTEFAGLFHLPAIMDLKWHSGVPDIAQVDSECAPTSAANSLRWLAEKNGFNAKLPATNAALITDLKTAMMTTPLNGTGDGKMVQGKQKVIDDKMLPLIVKFKDGNTVINGQAVMKPDKDFIWSELAHGEDIELGFTFTGAGGGGHWVTLVGGIKYNDGSVGVWVHDPDDKDKGKPHTEYYDLKMRADGYLEMVGYGHAHFMDIVVSESVPEPSTLTFAFACLVATIISARRRRCTAAD